MCFWWKAAVRLRLHSSLFKIGLIEAGMPNGAYEPGVREE